MAELALPKNSRVVRGRTFEAPPGAKNVRAFKIYRWSPDDSENPRLDTYKLDMDRGWVTPPGYPAGKAFAAVAP